MTNAHFTRRGLKIILTSQKSMRRLSFENTYWGILCKSHHFNGNATISAVEQKRYFGNMNTNLTVSTTSLSPALTQRVKGMKDRHDEIVQILSTESSHSQQDLGKELSKLAPISSLYHNLENCIEEIKSVQELLHESQEFKDDVMEKECQNEIELLHKKISILNTRIMEAILPKEDEDYDADAIIEIRAGTGGDEASLFAQELISTYEKTSKNRGWSCEILQLSKTDLGGVREAALSITSNNNSSGCYSHVEDTFDWESLELDSANSTDSSSLLDLSPYGYYKYESGVHRVQRVPVNDVRIHTSTASVAVFPSTNNKSNNNNAALPTSELKIETFRASGAGGQHVNTTESAVRITHIPTGITAAIQDERSQHKNKSKALKLIAARVHNQKKEEEAKARGEMRSALMGGGGRSERIRTYNFPQDRVTDHRCKHSEYGIEKLLHGGGTSDSGDDFGLVGCFAPHMRRLYREEVLQEMEEEEEA